MDFDQVCENMDALILFADNYCCIYFHIANVKVVFRLDLEPTLSYTQRSSAK